MYSDLIRDKKMYSLETPSTIVPSPTDDEYFDGIITRYFAQRVNDSNGFIYEVDFNVYNELKQNPYWLTEDIKWRISGPLEPVYDNNGKLVDKGVKNSNISSIAFGQEKIKNLNLYLINNLQFYK